MKTIALCLAFLLLTSCATTGPIEQFNGNTSLPLALTLSEAEIALGDDYRRVDGFGGYGYESEGLFITIAGWLDVQDDYHVIRYRIKDATYHVFGITVGFGGEEAQKILTKSGYRLTEHAYSDWIYEKDDAVRFTLCINDDGVVTELFVEAIAHQSRRDCVLANNLPPAFSQKSRHSLPMKTLHRQSFHRYPP